MTPHRRNKFIIGFVLFLFSLIAIILSNDSSKLSSPFTSVSDKKEQVEGVSVKSEEQVENESPTVEVENISSVDELVSPADTIEEASKTTYKVVKVVDGDTIDVNIDGKIERLRLIGIDTPETVDPRKPVQCFGKAASDKAKEVLTGQSVVLESDPSQGERDKYKRLLRYVFLEDETNYNKFMIEEGYAHEYTYNTPYKYQQEFKQAEIDARTNYRGLWSPETCSGNK